MDTAVADVAPDAIRFVGVVDQESRPAEIQRVGAERVIGARRDDCGQFRTLGADRGRWIPGRVCILARHPRGAERRLPSDDADADRIGEHPVAPRWKVEHAILPEIHDDALARRVGQDVKGGDDQPAADPRCKLIDPRVRGRQRGIADVEFPCDVVHSFARLDDIFANLADDLLAGRERIFTRRGRLHRRCTDQKDRSRTKTKPTVPARFAFRQRPDHAATPIMSDAAASPPNEGAKTPLAVFYNYLRKLRWYTSDVVDRAAMACCAIDNAWLAVASARAATAHASQGGGGAAQAPSNSNGVPSASTRANVIELFRVSLVIPYLPSQRRRSSVRWWRALAPEEACAHLASRCCTDVAVRSNLIST